MLQVEIYGRVRRAVRVEGRSSACGGHGGRAVARDGAEDAAVRGTYGDQDNNHFALLDRDAESDTDHAQFRQYYNAWGRWMSPDPYSGSYDMTNPQSFNRYSYAMNSPMESVDPTGLCTPTGKVHRETCPPDVGGGSIDGIDAYDDPFGISQIPVVGIGFGWIPTNAIPAQTGSFDDPYATFTGTTTAYWGWGSINLGTQYLSWGTDPAVSYTGGLVANTASPNQPKVPTNFDYWKQDMQTCLGIAGQTFSNDMSPFALGIGTAASVTSTMGQASAEGAASWSLQRGLPFPLRSSIVRGGMESAEALGEVSYWLAVIGTYYAAGDAVYAEAKGCL